MSFACMQSTILPKNKNVMGIVKSDQVSVGIVSIVQYNTISVSRKCEDMWKCLNLKEKLLMTKNTR